MATKTESIAVKVTPEEKEQIKKLADKADVTVSKYLYRILFKKETVNKEKYLARLQDYILDSAYEDLTVEELLKLYDNALKGE